VKSNLTGLIKGLANRDYHATAPVSASNVIDMGTSFKYFHWKKNQAEREETASMTLGTAAHTAVLEPNLFDSQYTVIPESAPRRPTSVQLGAKKPSPETIAAIQYWEQLERMNAGKTILSASDYDRVMGMRDAVFAHKDAKAFLSGGEAEVSCFSKYPGIAVDVKCRPDYLRMDDGLSINFKTSHNSSFNGFMGSVKDWSYDWQSAFYCDILSHMFNRHFDELHIVVESQPPHHVALYTFEEDSLEFARSQFRPLLEKYLLCLETDIWPGLPEIVQTVSVPAWARKVVML
jgi:exodeoxyribonuclease VIII